MHWQNICSLTNSAEACLSSRWCCNKFKSNNHAKKKKKDLQYLHREISGSGSCKVLHDDRRLDDNFVWLLFCAGQAACRLFFISLLKTAVSCCLRQKRRVKPRWEMPQRCFWAFFGIIFDVTLKSKHFSVAVRLFSIAISCLPASFTEPEPCSLSSFCFLYWLRVYFSHFVDFFLFFPPSTRMLTGCYWNSVTSYLGRKELKAPQKLKWTPELVIFLSTFRAKSISDYGLLMTNKVPVCLLL